MPNVYALVSIGDKVKGGLTKIAIDMTEFLESKSKKSKSIGFPMLSQL